MQTRPSSTHHPKRLSARSIRRWLLLIVPLTALILAATLVVDVTDLCAHSPHDAIDYLALSPTYDRDQTLFIVLIDQIQRSTDGGSSWKQLVNGLDHNHRLSAIALSPSFAQDGTMFLSSIGSGIFRSQDRGDSWIRVNDGLGTLDIGAIEIEPTSNGPLVLLAAGIDSGLYRSENGGEGWEQIAVAPTATGGDVKVTALAFAPGDEVSPTSKAYLGDDQGRLYLSTDGGATWTKVWDTPGGSAVTAIAVSPPDASGAALFVGTHAAGIWEGSEQDHSFTPINKGLPFSFQDRYLTLRRSKEGPALRPSELDVTAIALAPNGERAPTLLAALWNQAVFRSDNGGQSWNRYRLGLSCDYQADSEAYKSPHFRQVRLSNAFATDETVFVGGFDGLFKSTNGGRRWTQMETLPVKLVAGLAATAESETSSAQTKTYDGLPSIAITTYGGGIYTSGDGGKTWQIRNKGLSTTRLTDIVFSPATSKDSAIVTASYGRLVQSQPDSDAWAETAIAQKSWRTYLVNRLKRVGVPDALARILLNRSEREKPYPTVFALSPQFDSSAAAGGAAQNSSDKTIFFGTRRHGIFRSLDGGRSASVVWSDASAGDPALVSSLAISPNFASPAGAAEEEDRTLFAGIYGQGVLKTVDGGETWRTMNNGLTFIERWQSEDMGYALERQNVRLVISPNYASRDGNASDQTLFAGSGDGLFKTTNGGESWQELHIAGLSRAYVVALAISPGYSRDQTILISVRGKGLYRSEDGGATFEKVGAELANHNYAIRWISYSPNYAKDHTLWAASDEELLVSMDRGDTWQAIDRPVRYEDSREVIQFEGAWTTVAAEDASARTVTYSESTDSQATLHFVGTGVRWVGIQDSNGGIARIYLDGNEIGTVDQYTSQPKSNGSALETVLFKVSDLSYGPHTVLIQVTGTKNRQATGARVYVDAIDVLGTTSVTR